MAKTPNISSLSSGFRSSNKLNENFDEIKQAFENTLSRDGSSPNHMEADLDMNGQRIYNLPEPTTDHEPARYVDILGVVDEATQAVEDAENAKLAAEEAQLAAEAAQQGAEDAEDGAVLAQEAAETARDEAVLATTNKLDIDGANVGDNAPDLRTAIAAPHILTEENQGGLTAAQVAAIAYANNLPYLKEVDVDVMVDVSSDLLAATTDEERHAVLENAFKWQGRQPKVGYGDIGVKMPEGLIKIGNRQFLRAKNQGRLYIEAAGAPDFIDITGISSTVVSGTLREVTFTVGAALPARVETDYWVTVQNMNGDNDARAFDGSWRVIDVAMDRLSFTARRRFPVTPTDPTTINNGGVSNGLLESKLLVPKTCLVGQHTSASNEGMFTLRDGAVAQSKWMGFGSYNDDADTEGCIVQIEGDGSRWDSMDYETWGNGPDRIIRCTFGGGFYANRAGFGGDHRTSMSELIGTQGGGFVGLIRCSIGGGDGSCLLFGQGTSAYVAQCSIVGGADAAVRAIGASTILLYPNIVGYASVGVLADASRIICNSGGSATLTTIRNLVGHSGRRGGEIIGPITSVSDTLAGTALANMRRDGYTYRTSDVNPTEGGRSVTVNQNVTMEAPLSGTYGRVRILGRNALHHAWTARVRATGTSTTFVREVIGADSRDEYGGNSLDPGTTDLAAQRALGDVNPGRITFNVWNDSGTCKLQILNEDSATPRVFDIIVEGDLSLGAFTEG